MNKTIILLGFFVLILVGLIGCAVLYIYRPDEVGNFVTSVVTLLGIGSAAVVTIFGLGEQAKKLDTIKSNTNGTLSAMQEENKRLTNIIVERGLDATTGSGQHRADDSES
ncbi:hypothetical protein EV379_0916 [Microterricola gilva]|uniref:Uncharacterized protein n=1 Tax=Microterricola gilva TaxID=393267 RepID=A0A4Q8AL00_9MICO|nr:hypothetical protein [Microterricola gilva]RZU64613.1 hypothetical protein EV379_0916 [Microterricola gilva]